MDRAPDVPCGREPPAPAAPPTFFIHTPDDADTPALARRFHDEVRARVPDPAPLPDPKPAQPITLFQVVLL